MEHGAMGKQTPIARKVRKSTPAGVPVKRKDIPNARTGLSLNGPSSADISSICTPVRTTRSMLRHVSDEMVSPMPSYVTPSKKNTIASIKTSAKKSSAKKQDAASDFRFVRPKLPKIKLNDTTLQDDTISDESITQAMKPKGRSTKGRKASKANGKGMESNDEDDLPSVSVLAGKSHESNNDSVSTDEEGLPSVSFLGQNSCSSTKKARKSIYGRKLNESNNGFVSTDEEGLPPVSFLGKNSCSSTKKPRKSIRDRKLNESNNGIGSNDDEDLPSVSILGSENIQGWYVRSPAWQESRSPKIIEANDDGNVLNSSNASDRKIIRTRKSTRMSTLANPSNEIAPNDNNDHNKSSSEEVTSAADRTDQIASKTEITSKSPDFDSVEVELQSKPEPDVENETEFNDDGLASVSVLATLKSAKKSMKQCDATLVAESEQKMSSSVKRTVKFTSPIIIDNPKSDLEASYERKSDESTEHSEIGETTEQNNVDDKEPPTKTNRISIIDLTDSPGNSNRTLNTTYPPQTKPASDANEDANRTFTEESDNTARGRTFSPVPSIAPNAGYLTPLLVLSNSSSKPASKKKSPLAKRLKGTPIRKSAHNLNTPGKLSAAKKSKIVEAAYGLVDLSAKKKMKPPKLNASTPKVFRFGDENNKDHDFRFSLLPPGMNPNLCAKNNKSAVKKVPDFKNIHGRHFMKADSLDEEVERHSQRALLLLSGKNPASAKKQVQKADKVQRAEKAETQPEQSQRAVVKKKPEAQKEIRRPLGHVNRARLNDEERQERRRQLFKQSGTKRQQAGGKKLKGLNEVVKLNRRFELLMAQRNMKMN